MKKRLLFGIVALIAAFSIIGCKEEEEEKEPFKLTVTGIPSETSVQGASLMATSNPTTPIAIGMNNGSGTFAFYEPNATGRMPDSDKPFNTNGTYIVALAKVNMTTFQEEDVWMHGTNIQQPTPVQFSGDVTLAWNAFTKVQQQP